MKTLINTLALSLLMMTQVPTVQAADACTGAQARTQLALMAYIAALRFGTQVEQIRARINLQNAAASEARLCRIK